MDDESVDLVAGSSRAVIDPGAGGRLAQLDLGSGPVLRGPEDGRSWHDWGCYPLLPWSNRIPGGRFEFGGTEAQVPVNHDDGSALHGLAADRRWSLDRRSSDQAQLSVTLIVEPFDVRGRMRYRLADGALDIDLEVENLGRSAIPAGLGIHPWFRSGPIRVPASRRWPGDPIPTGPSEPVGPDDDLRSLRVPPLLDRCFTGLVGDTAEVPGATLAWRGPIEHVVVYTGATGWVAVEPVTMANDGFGLAHRGIAGHGVRVLEPGETLAVAYRISEAD